MKKKVIVGICSGVVGLIIIVVVIFLLTRKSVYTVSFMVDDSVYQTIEIEENKTIFEPVVPEKEGYVFAGWYYEGVPFDFMLGIRVDLILEARWEAIDMDIPDVGTLASIPNVYNLTVEEATKVLEQEGFVVAEEIVEVASTSLEVGRVVRTSPAAGSERSEGTVVTLYISTGNGLIEIEDYTGSSYLEVKGRLEALGLYVLIERRDVEDTEEDTYEDGEIIDQSIEAGERVSAGTNITLYIPNIVTYYPDFTDGSYTVDDVEDFADTYELNVEITYEETSEATPGTIIRQLRPTTQRVVAGQSFTITIAESSTEGNNGKVENCESGLC